MIAPGMGRTPTFDFRLTHWDMARPSESWIFPGAKVAGSRFPLLVSAGARLGVIDQPQMDVHSQEHVQGLWRAVRREPGCGAGDRAPKFGGDMYEVPLDGLPGAHRGDRSRTTPGRLPDALPIRYVAYTPTSGAGRRARQEETRGLIQVSVR